MPGFTQNAAILAGIFTGVVQATLWQSAVELHLCGLEIKMTDYQVSPGNAHVIRRGFNSGLSCFILFVVCCFWTAYIVESRALSMYDESYYEYVPDRLAWHDAGRLCNQRSGALATVSNSLENQELNSFLKSLNISQPVWIARKVMTHLKSEFPVPFLTLFIDTSAPSFLIQ